jgi:hypothetical protein
MCQEGLCSMELVTVSSCITNPRSRAAQIPGAKSAVRLDFVRWCVKFVVRHRAPPCGVCNFGAPSRFLKRLRVLLNDVSLDLSSRFELFTVMTMKNATFSDMTPCIMVDIYRI